MNNNSQNLSAISKSKQGDTDRVLDVMCGQLALTRIPLTEPGVFNGSNPLAFPLWKVSFDSLTSNRAMTASDRVNLLVRFLGGEARMAVECFLTLEPEQAFDEAYRLLVRRYGDKFELANNYCKKLKSWPQVSGTDISGLRRYVDFLRQCLTAKSNLKGLAILDIESENTDMVRKLPVWLSRKWARKVSSYREEYEDYPSFAVFVGFLEREDKKAPDPLARALQKLK